MIISHAALNGIQISACELMTKWDKARTHTHKLTIKEQHAGAALSGSVWPLGVTARPYEQRTRSIRSTRENSEGDTERHVRWNSTVSTRLFS